MRSSLRSAAEEAEAAVGLSTEVEVVVAAEDEVEAAAGCCC